MSDEGDDSWLPAELLEGAGGLDAELLDIQRKLLRAKLFGVGSGVQLAGYELIGEIGRGAMGVVYAGRDPRLDRKVALKLVQDGDEPELRHRLVREARAMAKLDHPNVVPIYEIHETPKLAFIVMPLVEGVTLRRWQDAAPRALAELLAAYLAAGRGLAAAHRVGLVHRDFKPDNVMIDDAGKVRVMDFGLAQLDGSREQTLALTAQTTAPRGTWDGARPLTQTGALVGTPAYMAPEQLHGLRADASSDQFSFCVALYEALYGVRPFAEGSFEEMRAAMTAGRVRVPEPNVAKAILAVILRGLDPLPLRRFPTMEALLAALDEAAAPGAEARHASDTALDAAASDEHSVDGLEITQSVTPRHRLDVGHTESGASMNTKVLEPTRSIHDETTSTGAAAAAAAELGARPPNFDGYELLGRLGEGGMGEVWSARRRGLGGSVKHVAIKLIASRHYEDPYLRELFLTEARLSMLLSNSRIVQVFEVGEFDDTCYMVMEWIDGLNLAEFTRALRKRGGQLTHGQAAFILAELLRALTYAHEPTAERDHPLIHRDISPQNVMLSLTGEVKLMDFGIATLMSDESSGGGVKGKPRYMPPEQFVDRVRRPTIDLFALGAIFHELVDNRVFRSEVVDGGELYGMIVSGRYPSLREALPPELEALHAGLLEPDPDKRIPSAREALRQLRAWSGFRDLSEEIEALVRELSGRGSLEMLADSGRISGRHAALSSEDLAVDSPGARASLGRAPTQLMDPPAPDESGRRPRRALAALLALPLLALGGYGLWWVSGAGQDPRELAATTADERPGPDPAVDVPPETKDERAPVDEPGAVPVPVPVPVPEEDEAIGETIGEAIEETEPPSAKDGQRSGQDVDAPNKPATKRGTVDEPEAPAAPGPDPTPAPVPVVIEQHGQFCIDVRLGAEAVRNIERKARTVERAPGSLACAVRVCGEDSWHSVANLSLAPGSSPTLYIDWPRQAPEPDLVELR